MKTDVEKFELSPSYSLHNGVVVIEQDINFLKFGMTDISDRKLMERLERSARSFFNSCSTVVRFESVTFKELEKLVTRNYGISTHDREGGTAVLLLDSLIREAVNKNVTDIHIENDRVRFRINGVLKTECLLENSKSLELIRRVKVLSKMDVLEKRKGQDGQFVFKTERGSVFIRCSCICVTGGEDFEEGEEAVLRILNPQRLPLKIECLGFTEAQQQLIKKISREKNGLVLISGATGSGKSTTASSILSLIKNEGGERKIITVEDPPEYVLKNITQIKVDEKVNMDFDSALRFIFRQDPDVIFIGEIRDELSAKTALRAALTGHLVLATVHAEGFYGTLMRLKDLGLDYQTLCHGLKAIIRQKLTEEEDMVFLEASVLDIDSLISGQLLKEKDSLKLKKLMEDSAL